MQSIERSALSGWPLVRNFYTRRFFRIYPLSTVTVLAALTLRLDSDINGIAGLSSGALPGKVSILSHLLLVQNLTHVKSIVNVLWSLPFEVQMYVLLPFLFVWFCNKRSFWPVAILWLSSVVLAIIQPSAPGLSRISILRFMPNFVAGLIAFNLPRVQRFRAFFWPLLLAGLIAIFTLNPAPTTGWILCLVLGLAVPFFAEITTPWIRVASKHIAT